MIGIIPLPARRDDRRHGVADPRVPGGRPRPPLSCLERDRRQRTPRRIDAAAPRVQRWKNTLLDLSLRNKLINFTESRLACACRRALPHVEDLLNAGKPITLRPPTGTTTSSGRAASSSGAPAARPAARVPRQAAMFTPVCRRLPDAGSAAWRTRPQDHRRGDRRQQPLPGPRFAELVPRDGRRSARRSSWCRSPWSPTARRALPTRPGRVRGEHAELLPDREAAPGRGWPSPAWRTRRGRARHRPRGDLRRRARRLPSKGLPFHVDETADLAILQFAKFRLWKDLDDTGSSWPIPARPPHDRDPDSELRRPGRRRRGR